MKKNNSLGWTIFILVILGTTGYILLNNFYVTQKTVNTGESDECNTGQSEKMFIDREDVSAFIWWDCMDVCKNQNYKHDNTAICNSNKQLICECRVTAYDQYIYPLFSR